MHTCHAYQCDAPVKPEIFMCLRHWRRVPRELQRRIWALYRPGQCDDKQITKAYGITAKQALRAVAAKEGISIPENAPELRLYDMCAGEELP